MFLGAQEADKELALTNSYKAIKIKNFIELLTPAVKAKIADIKELLPITSEVYAGVFEPLIEQIIIYVQLIPQSYNENLGSMLYTALLRTEWILNHWQMPKPADENDYWDIYVVFSAALLKNIDRIFQYYQINLLDSDGGFLRYWMPYTGSMLGQGAYYTLLPLYTDNRNYSPEIIAILAKQMISNDVYQLLASNQNLYYQWLALIKGESHPYGTFDAVLALFKDERLHGFLKENADGGGFNAEYLDGFDLQYGVDFLDWLRKETADGNLAVNTDDASVHVIRQGIFIEPSVLVEYLRRSATHCPFMKAWLQFVSAMGGYNIDINNPTSYMLQANYETKTQVAVKRSASFMGENLQQQTSVKSFREGGLAARGVLPGLSSTSISANISLDAGSMPKLAARTEQANKNGPRIK